MDIFGTPKRTDIRHYMYVPFTGLGLYGGYRGDKWLKNRITLFKEYVIPSLLTQSNKNFTLLISWREEERFNPIVIEFKDYLKHTSLDFIFTYNGILFWDDKYPKAEAEKRLRESLRKTLPQLKEKEEYEADWILLTIQPSDDLYIYDVVERLQEQKMEEKAVGFNKGYIMRYDNKEVSEYNPTTNPPFYTIYYPRDKFFDPDKHFDYIHNESHEYVKDFLPVNYLDFRGFIVGCHGENISTAYNIPFKGRQLSKSETGDVLRKAGILEAKPLKVGKGWKRYIWFRLPHRVRRKLRYWFGEKFYVRFYNFING